MILFVRHVLAHVKALLVHHVSERPTHAGLRRHRRISERHDEHQAQQVRHAEDAFERFLDMDGDVLGAEPERGGRKMHQHGGVGQPVGQMRLVAPERVGALYGRPLAAPVARNDNQDRSRRPADLGALALHRLLMGHLIGRMAQLEIALLLHPVDEFLVLLRIGPEQLLLDRRVLDHDEFPRLRIGARHRPAPGFENLVDVVVRDRIGLELRTLMRRARCRRADRNREYRSSSLTSAWIGSGPELPPPSPRPHDCGHKRLPALASAAPTCKA